MPEYTEIYWEGKFSVKSQYLDEVIGARGTIKEQETMEDAILETRKRIHALVQSYAPNAQVEAIPAGQSFAATLVIQTEKTDKHGEAIDAGIAISECTTIEELSQYKFLASSDAILRQLYMDKLKNLTNGTSS